MKNFKKLAFLTLAVVSLFSCSKDDAPALPPVLPAVTIIDDWSLEKTGNMDVSNTITQENDWSHDCTTKKDYLILTAPNNFTINYFSAACEATYFAREVGTYTLNDTNDRLVISGGTDWDGNYAILTLTQTELLLKKVSLGGKMASKLKLPPSNNYYKFSRRT